MEIRKHCFCHISLFFLLAGIACASPSMTGLPLYYWKHQKFINFGDYLSLVVVERMIGQRVRVYEKNSAMREKRLIAIGSIISLAQQNDVIWGSGLKSATYNAAKYPFSQLDVRAVRGPLTRASLMRNFNISCPEIYGDPALLIPSLFPEFKRKESPAYPYIIIPHYSEQHLFLKDRYSHIVYPTEDWRTIIEKILDSAFVIASSLHGIIVAEAFGIPSRMLRVTENEPLFKYADYYQGTGRTTFTPATSIEEALIMGGEPPARCDLQKLYKAFPFEFWPHASAPNIHLGA